MIKGMGFVIPKRWDDEFEVPMNLIPSNRVSISLGMRSPSPKALRLPLILKLLEVSAEGAKKPIGIKSPKLQPLRKF